MSLNQWDLESFLWPSARLTSHCNLRAHKKSRSFALFLLLKNIPFSLQRRPSKQTLGLDPFSVQHPHCVGGHATQQQLSLWFASFCSQQAHQSAQPQSHHSNCPPSLLFLSSTPLLPSTPLPSLSTPPLSQSRQQQQAIRIAPFISQCPHHTRFPVRSKQHPAFEGCCHSWWKGSSASETFH
ncbi:unnamed protein product [Closterium sp. NIES-54]